jgi:hypothetical protein
MRVLARLLLSLLCLATLATPLTAAVRPTATQTIAATQATHCEHPAPAAHVHHDGAAANTEPGHGLCAACVGHCLPAVLAVLAPARWHGRAVPPATVAAGQPGVTTLPELKPPRG